MLRTPEMFPISWNCHFTMLPRPWDLTLAVLEMAPCIPWYTLLLADHGIWARQVPPSCRRFMARLSWSRLWVSLTISAGKPQKQDDGPPLLLCVDDIRLLEDEASGFASKLRLFKKPAKWSAVRSWKVSSAREVFVRDLPVEVWHGASMGLSWSCPKVCHATQNSWD